jgi:UDP:flavonoid glycosyltransferase YjiC (YdhE family)
MRCLFTVQPMFGHFNAMVPLARALQDAGHDVAFATGKGFGPIVHRAGFRHFPCGLDFDGSDHLLKLERTWPPELIIRDPVEFGGYLAAECWEIPHATVMWAFYIAARLAIGDELLALRQRYGLPADPNLDTLDRYLVLDFLPASWMFPTWPPLPVTHRFCAPPFDLSDGTGLPDWLDSLPPQPIVYATLGTTCNQAAATFQAIVKAFIDEKVNLIVTVGRSNDPARFQPPVDHIKIARYIPQSLLLPRCDAVIFHGGYNTLLSALWCGLPMVVIPQEAGDQFPTAQRCAEAGVGMMVEGSSPAPEAVRIAVEAVLTQPDYRVRALQFQNELQALPSLREAVRRLETLVRTGEPQLYRAGTVSEP